MNKFDIIIYGVNQRIYNINTNKNKLASTNPVIILDDRPEGGGSFYTAEKAWRYPVEDCITHRVCLQDDIDISDNFLEVVQQMIDTHPDAIITLMPFGPKLDSESTIRWQQFFNTPYIVPMQPSGPGIIMPVKYIEQIYSNLSSDKYRKKDAEEDIMFYLFAIRNNIPYISSNPAIINHIGDISMMRHNAPIRRNDKYFKKQAIADWANKTVVDLRCVK